MKKFTFFLLLFSTLSLSAIGLTNLNQQLAISGISESQKIENLQTHQFEIENSSNLNKLVKFEISNKNFVLNTPYQIQLKPEEKKIVEIKNLKEYQKADLIISTDNIQRKFIISSIDSNLKIDQTSLNFEDQILNSGKRLEFSIQNKNQENVSIELRFNNQVKNFEIIGRNNFVVEEKETKKIQIKSNCSTLGNKEQILGIYKNNQLIEKINLKANCTPNYNEIAFITNPPKKIDLGFVSSKSKKIQNYSLINIGKKNLQIKEAKKTEFFNFKFSNNKLIISINNKNIDCKNCLIKETLILKTNDPFKPYLLIPVQAYIYEDNTKEFNLEYSLINPCLDTPKIILKANNTFNFEILENGKSKLKSDMYLKQYIINVPCNVNAEYEIKYESINAKGVAKLHTQNQAVISISKNQLNIDDINDRIYIVSRKNYNLPLNLEILNQNNEVLFQKEIINNKSELKSTELQNLEEGNYTIEIFNREIKTTKKIKLAKKKLN